MGPALSPGAVGQEMAAVRGAGWCAGRGAGRSAHPGQGRVPPDMLFVGAVLMALQSYAVSQSQAGQLRGYMALAAFCAAVAVQAALRPLFAAAEAFAGKTAAGAGAARRPVHRPAESCPRRRQSTAERKKTCKKTEKELANTTAYVV